MKITNEQIDKELMDAGYLCPDYSIHYWELLEWEGNVRNMKCEKCGNIMVAMAKTNEK
mgnify:CR=1 FL=1